MAIAVAEDDSTMMKLELACADLKKILQASNKMEEELEKLGNNFDTMEQTISAASRSLAPLPSSAMTTKALETRINRAVNPALELLDSFRLVESLQHKLLQLSSKASSLKNSKKRLKLLLKYFDFFDQLNVTVNTISQDGEPVIRKLQEVVEFLSRTKATDQYRTHTLRETLVTLKALYVTEVDATRFEGLLDQALLNLQDEFEGVLLQLRHQNLDELNEDNETDQGSPSDLATELDIQVLTRISEILATNDCLDICIDIFIKVRYRMAAKALMRLNPKYLKTYTPEQIDEMKWESLETAITLWIQHLELAVKSVIVSEKKLCIQVMGGIMEGGIWPECFFKIADKIMAVFFRFGEGVSRSRKETQKLFKLLDMFDALEKLKIQFSEIFEGEAGADSCKRFRELEKLLIHASSGVFWEFGLQIEGNTDGFLPPQDGSMPKLVRYAINYLKYLATETYSVSMAKVLRSEQKWKTDILSKPATDENLLEEAISNIMEALRRNVDSKRTYYKDRILAHVFAMNTYWYIYMRTRNTELGKLLGEQNMKKKYKAAAEESAYMYQRQAWGPIVRLLDFDKEGDIGVVAVRGKLEAFLKGFDELSQRHRDVYNIPDDDLREQIKETTIKLVIAAYTEFLNSYSSLLQGNLYVSPESIEGLLCQIFDDDERKLKLRDSKDRTSGGDGGGNLASVKAKGEIKVFHRYSDREFSDV